MSTIVPIVPPVIDEARTVNEPEADSERAARLKAEKARRFTEGEISPDASLDGSIARSVDREREIARALDRET